MALPTFGQPLMGFDDPLGGRMIAGAPAPQGAQNQPPDLALPTNTLAPQNLGIGAPQQSQQPQQSQPFLGFGQNKYTDNLASAMTRQSNQNLAQNVMPQIGQGAQMAGQYGGSRQGIAQGVAAGNAQTGLDSAISNMYSQAYGQDQNFFSNLRGQEINKELTSRGQDQNFFLGNQGQMQNFYTQQRGQDQAGVQLGANLYGMGNSGNLGIGAGQYALGQTHMNAPLNAASQYAGVINPYLNVNGGTNSSHSSTTTNYGADGKPVGGGNGIGEAIGAGLGAYQGIRNSYGGGSPSIGSGGYSNDNLGLSGSGGYQAGGGYGSVPYGISN